MQKIFIYTFLLILAACSAAKLRTPNGHGMHVFMESEDGSLRETHVVPPNFALLGVWVSGVSGDLRAYTDGSRTRMVLYETDVVRRVQMGAAILVATRYLTAQPLVESASVVLLEPREWNSTTPRPTVTLHINPALP